VEPGRCHDHALDPCRKQYPGQSEAGGPATWTTRTGPGNPAAQPVIPGLCAARLWRRISPVPVDSAAFHTARLDIQTDVGTLIPGRNLQTFKCGSAGPTSAP
jgi:hypothetical protein